MTNPEARKNASVSAVAPKYAATTACLTNPTSLMNTANTETATDEATMPPPLFRDATFDTRNTAYSTMNL